MLRFGSDKPDLRFGLEIADLGDGRRGHRVPGLLGRARRPAAWCAGSTPAPREAPRTELDAADRGRQALRRGRARVGVRAGGRHAGARRPRRRSPTTERAAIAQRARSAKPGDLLLIVADASATVAATALGELRLELARRYDLIPAGRHELLWVVDFPMFEWNDERAALGRAAPPVHGADRLVRGPGRAALARATTSCSTAPRSAAGRSVSTAPRSSSRCSPRSGSPRRRPRRASASCSTRCGTARRRTAGIALGIDRIVAILAGPRLDPRRDRVPEDGERGGPADRRARRRWTPRSSPSSASRLHRRRPGLARSPRVETPSAKDPAVDVPIRRA